MDKDVTPAPSSSLLIPAMPDLDHGRSPAPEQGVGLSQARQIHIRILANENEANCRFWVGLSGRGSRTPASLMEIEGIRDVLTEAARSGLTEVGPLMLSDADQTPPRFIYLLPTPAADFRQRAQWIHEAVQTVKSWTPESVGFYLAPELVTPPQSHDLLLAVLRELIESTATAEFFLLVGSYGTNSLVNAALRLKTEMENDLVNLYVYH